MHDWLEVTRGDAPLLISFPHTGVELDPMMSGALVSNSSCNSLERETRSSCTSLPFSPSATFSASRRSPIEELISATRLFSARPRSPARACNVVSSSCVAAPSVEWISESRAPIVSTTSRPR